MGTKQDHSLIGGIMASGGHNEAKFQAAIIAKSVSQTWDDAKAEWNLSFVYLDYDDRSCVCEHSPIQQICVIRNRRNNEKMDVGNVCVRRFMRIVANSIFAVLKRVQNNIEKSLNPKSLEIFREHGVITHQEEQEYGEFWRKRKLLTDDQKAQKIDINRRVLDYFVTETTRLREQARAFNIKV